MRKRILFAAGCVLLMALAIGDVATGQGVSAVSGSPVPPPQMKQQPAQPQPQSKGKATGRGRGTQLKSEPGLGGNQPRLTRHPNQFQQQQQHHQGQGGQSNPGAGASAGSNANNNKVRPSKYADALKRYRHERHNQVWWKQRYTLIVLVSGGYYYWDAGYWCPAWGYDSRYESYDYDGPIYTYGNLLPDQVILNVQRALKELGYYEGGLTGSLNLTTRQALANYQEDAGLEATGAIDAATVEALGLVRD